MSQGFPTEAATLDQTSRKSGGGRTVTWMLIIFGILGGGCAICCCGIGGMMYFGLDQMAKQVKDRFDDEPVVIEMLGGIDTCTFNFGETVNEQQRREDTWVFDVQGPDGSGQLILWAPGGDPSSPEDAALRQGTVDYPITPSAAFDPLLE